MVTFNKDAQIIAMITADGPEAMSAGDGEAKKLNQAMGGGLGLFFDKEDGQLYAGVGGVITGKRQALMYEYDAENLSKVIGNVEMDGQDYPANFRTLNGFIEVLEDVTSAGAATISIGTKSGAATNLLAATGKASLTAGDIIQLIPDTGTISDSVKETAVQRPVAGIAGADLTAGRFKVVLEGFIVA